MVARKRYIFILLCIVAIISSVVFIGLLTKKPSLQPQDIQSVDNDLPTQESEAVNNDTEKDVLPDLSKSLTEKEKSAYTLWSQPDLRNEEEAALQRFYKVDDEGNILPDTASEWQCVYNDATGLLWEVKQSDGGWQDYEHTYSWYQPNAEEIEQLALGSTVTDLLSVPERGKADAGTCYVIYCDTYHYMQAFNEENICASRDWRLPSAHELGYLDHKSQYNPDIDSEYFPNTAIDRYWSQTETPDVNSLAWSVDFKNGIPYINEKRLALRIRLVANAPYLRDQVKP